MGWEWFRKRVTPPSDIQDVERPVLAVVVDQLRDLKQRQDQLEIQWTDTLDKLLAREERERKRMQKLLKSRVEPDQEAEATETPTDDRSSRLRAIRARIAARNAQKAG